MSKITPEIIKQMAAWVEENGLINYGGASLSSFLNAFSIDQRTYYRWMGKTEFADEIKKAKDIFLSTLERDIVHSLARTAKGYEYEKKEREYSPPKKPGEKGELKKMKVTTMRVEPNVGAAIFLLTNIAPDRWKNKFAGKESKPAEEDFVDLSQLSTEELNELNRLLSKAGKND